MSRDRTYTSDDIDVLWSKTRCIHAAECVRGLKTVFDTSKRPWIQPDQATADDIAAAVARCPTGALRYVRKDGGGVEQAPPTNTVCVMANGPLYLHGDIEVVDADGAVLCSDQRIALCRCGQSSSKPFCDNAHRSAGFNDPGVISRESAGDLPNGKLIVTVRRNGALSLAGPLELSDGDQVVRLRSEKSWLCRCGQSRNKPFCDGTHKRVGFEG
jgi:CDGSH-type Zn-finger protein/uncharacterized Fe-S cluster protein YjdI